VPELSRRNFLLAAAGSPFARRLSAAEAPLAERVRAGKLKAAVLMVATGRQRFARAFGEAAPDTVFLLASVTKPMTAAVMMKLVDEGKLKLDDPVSGHLPELDGERAAITVRQLLNHTSGLPDMPPDNLELRKRHAPLSEFLRSALTVPLRKPPGADVHYQSMGFLLAAVLAEKLVGQPFPEQMRRVLFRPLRMGSTSLGLGGRSMAGTARCQVPDDPGGWNSPYWRNLGAPWGGALGNAADVTRLLRAFASGQAASLSRASTAAMLAPSKPEGDARQSGQPKQEHYGLGWRLGVGGRGCSPATFGHSGATGVTAWMDPQRDLSCVLLTTQPSAESQATLLGPVSDAVAAAM
jgi:CubicO group peptidase (beta-lactamase class C family)